MKTLRHIAIAIAKVHNPARINFVIIFAVLNKHFDNTTYPSETSVSPFIPSLAAVVRMRRMLHRKKESELSCVDRISVRIPISPSVRRRFRRLPESSTYFTAASSQPEPSRTRLERNLSQAELNRAAVNPLAPHTTFPPLRRQVQDVRASANR